MDPKDRIIQHYAQRLADTTQELMVVRAERDMLVEQQAQQTMPKDEDSPQ
jgi:hypothetical protein